MSILEKIHDFRFRRAFRKKSPNIKYTYGGYFEFIENIELGAYVYIGPFAFWSAKGGIVIGNNVIFGPKSAIWTYSHDYRSPQAIPYGFDDVCSKVTIGNNCWIGYNAVIMPGVEIGEGCIIGACSVVTKSFPAYSILVGNPAKVVGTRDKDQYERLKNEGKLFLLMKSGRGEI